jgi:UDP-glucuronate 4-epimerase
MNILVTGAAGFIGAHVALELLLRGHDVIGIDNLNDYYDVGLKTSRRDYVKSQIGDKNADNTSGRLNAHCGALTFLQLDIASMEPLQRVFDEHKIDRVVNLAAQAGVRYSLENPHAYIQSNIVGFTNILECCRHHSVEHLVYASSSSVYGANESMPFSVKDNVDHPLSLYAATKKSNELMAHTYSHLYGLPTTGLRFFTVYGPWGRPDMSPFLFVSAISKGLPIKVFNYGKHRRDFTYIDDIVTGVLGVLAQPAKGDESWSALAPNPNTSKAPFRLYNIGNSEPIELMAFIAAIEDALGKKAQKEMLPMQPGDVPDTYADVSELVDAIAYRPKMNIYDGVKHYVDWYRSYYS